MSDSVLYHPVKIGSLDLPGNLFLAPVAGFTDRIFRSICADYGADFTYTELASAEALIRGGKATLDLVSRGKSEKRYAVQLFGHKPETMYAAALALAPFHPEAVDINAGCPVAKVVKTGAGSALMKDPPLLGKIVESVVRASEEALGNVPVTIKMRSGWDSRSINYRECAKIARDAGAAMITLHPRTKAQGYGGKSDWSHIADLVSTLGNGISHGNDNFRGIPVTGSGDLFTPEDAGRMLRETGCAAVMFARGAEGNPFIFPAARSFLCTGSWTPAAFEERIAAAMKHLTALAEAMGERTACREMRKQFCAYTKPPPGKKGEPGFRNPPGSAALRNKLVFAETIEDYRVILKDFGIP